MKKASLLLMLAIALFTACTPSENANINTNQTPTPNVNVNANTNANVNPILPIRSKEDRTVIVVVYYDEKTNQPKMIVSPPTIKLLKAKNQKLRVHVFNNLDVEIKELVIKFKSQDPLEGGPDDLIIRNIAAGDDKVGKARKIKSGAADGVYKYGAEAIGTDDKRIVYIDPEVVINQGTE